MAKFSELVYNDGTLWGEGAKRELSIEPLTATALTYSSIALTWVTPSGQFKKIRVLRNQTAFPSTEEDGEIIYDADVTASTGAQSFSEFNPFIDDSASLITGRFVYYRAWILRVDNSEWVRAGETFTLLPATGIGAKGYTGVRAGYTGDSDVVLPTISTTHQRLMSYLPRVITSQTNGPTDVDDSSYSPYIDYAGRENNTLLYKFLEGFSFTMDEFITYTKLIIPSYSGEDSSPAILALQSQQFGMPADPMGTTKQQKRLVRDAVSIYSRKGTLSGLSTLVESMTGLSPTLLTNQNLMLSNQDSTFNIPGWVAGETVGYWTASTGATIAVDTTTTTVQTDVEPGAIDTLHTGKVITTGTNQSISIGNDAPVTRGIPVTAGYDYALTYYAKQLTSAGTVYPEITWYNSRGVVLSSSVDASGMALSTSWNSAVDSVHKVTAPVGAVYAGLSFKFDIADTYWLDMIQFAKVTTTHETAFLTWPRDTDLTSGDYKIPKFREARAVRVFLQPTKINYIPNPSFEVDLAGWSLTSGATSTRVNNSVDGEGYTGPPAIASGNYRRRITTKATGRTVLGLGEFVSGVPAGVQVPFGGFYNFSFYAKATTTGNVPLSVLLIGANSEGTTITNNQDGAYTFTLTSTWQRIDVSMALPLTANTIGDDYATVFANIYVDTTGTAEIFDIDCVMLENSYLPSDYFDGRSYGCSWEGTADNSVAYKYSNREPGLLRMNKELKDYLPFNTPYYIEYFKTNLDVDYSGIA